MSLRKSIHGVHLRPKRDPHARRGPRPLSNALNMFTQEEVNEFKEAFALIDQDRDGVVDRKDLRDAFAAVGIDVSNVVLDEMESDTFGPINFTMFLALFAERLRGTDPEETIRNAFTSFDHNNTGFIGTEYLRHVLTKMGNALSDKDVDELLKDAPVRDGKISIAEFARMLKRGATAD